METYYLFKFLIIGDEGVGKREFLQRSSLHFNPTTYFTIGAEIGIKNVLFDTISARFQLWVINPRERWYKIRKDYYTGSAGIILIFDINNPESFTNLTSWLEEIYRIAGLKIPVIILGNKCDKRGVNSVPLEVILAFCEKINASYLEISALQDSSFELVYYFLIHKILWFRFKDPNAIRHYSHCINETCLKSISDFEYSNKKIFPLCEYHYNHQSELPFPLDSQIIPYGQFDSYYLIRLIPPPFNPDLIVKKVQQNILLTETELQSPELLKYSSYLESKCENLDNLSAYQLQKTLKERELMKSSRYPLWL